MFLLYAIAMIPVVVGAILWVKTHKVIWWEWIVGCFIALLTSALIHFITFTTLTSDIKKISGIVNSVHHTPRWVAQWTETQMYTDSEGNTQTRTVTKRATHQARWWVETTIGKYFIERNEYERLKTNFGQESSRLGVRRNYYSGDRNDYYLVNSNNWREPIHDVVRWSNRIKASNTAFSFPQVPSNVNLFDYPKHNNLFRSNRLMGEARAFISLVELDRLNGTLFPSKKINIILIGFSDKESQEIATFQESKWIGGKQNDLVICFGVNSEGKASWAYVFGWSESELAKRNIETIFLTNTIDNDILGSVRQEIMSNYQNRDWSDFDYIAISPPLSSFVWLIVVMIITQSIFWVWCHHNDIHEETQYNNPNKNKFGRYRKYY